MQTVTAPVKPYETGVAATNATACMLFLIENGVIKTFDSPNQPTNDQLAELASKAKQELTTQTFGEASQRLVFHFQVQHGIGDQLGGTVDEATAAKLNEWLKKLGALDASPYRVEGTVLDSASRPVEGAEVRAYDRDMRKRQWLGTTKTDANGTFAVDYERAADHLQRARWFTYKQSAI